MKIKISSIIGNEYTNNKITKEIITEHMVQKLLYNDKNWKNNYLNSLYSNPNTYINIQEFNDRIEWDYVHEQEFISIKTIEELLQFSKDISCELIISNSSEIRIYDGYDG